MIDAFRLVSRNPDVNMWTRLDANLPSVKAALAALVDCDPAEIALNRNSTEGLSTVIFGVPCSLATKWWSPSGTIRVLSAAGSSAPHGTGSGLSECALILSTMMTPS